MQTTQTVQKYEDLGFSMPSGEGFPVSVVNHFLHFYAYETVNVWTDDGWLVTAVQNDGITHHLRKGCQILIRKIEPSQVLWFFQKTARYNHYFGLV